jgi:hypothetical protein
LMGSLGASNPFFVRCIKPNMNKVSPKRPFARARACVCVCVCVCLCETVFSMTVTSCPGCRNTSVGVRLKRLYPSRSDPGCERSLSLCVLFYTGPVRQQQHIPAQR